MYDICCAVYVVVDSTHIFSSSSVEAVDTVTYTATPLLALEALAVQLQAA
jgi:hypothetical protein